MLYFYVPLLSLYFSIYQDDKIMTNIQYSSVNLPLKGIVEEDVNSNPLWLPFLLSYKKNLVFSSDCPQSSVYCIVVVDDTSKILEFR